MAANPPLILRLLATSVKAVERAGRIIRDVRKSGNLGIVEKAKNDFQTLADRSSEKCILASLKNKFPDVKIVGEEGENLRDVEDDWIVKEVDKEILAIKCPQEYANIPTEDIDIWVDPLDGTGEYTRGFLEYVTVLVGIAVKGNPIAGVIHQPYYKHNGDDKKLGRTTWGIVGYGIGGFKPQPLPPGFIVLTTRTHSTPIVEEALAAVKPDQILRLGGAGTKMLVLSEGKAHSFLYASQGCMKWDICGPEAILVAVGGRLTDVHGNQYRYHKDVEHTNKGGVLATQKGVDHERLVSLIPKEVKDALV